MQVLESSPERLVLETRHKLFRAVGTVLLAIPVLGIVTIARSAVQWYLHPELLPAGGVPMVTLGVFAGLFVLGLMLLVYGPYRVTHIFDRQAHCYVEESTSVRRTRRIEYPLETFSGVEVQEGDEGGFHMLLVNLAGRKFPLGDQPSGQRAQVDAVADLVESFLTPA